MWIDCDGLRGLVMVRGCFLREASLIVVMNLSWKVQHHEDTYIEGYRALSTSGLRGVLSFESWSDSSTVPGGRQPKFCNTGRGTSSTASTKPRCLTFLPLVVAPPPRSGLVQLLSSISYAVLHRVYLPTSNKVH